MVKSTFNCGIGELVIIAQGAQLVYCNWLSPECAPKLNRILKKLAPDPTDDEIRVIQEALIQLKAYFAGQLMEFNLPACLDGTPFQQSVWRAMTKIGYGQTASYSDLAKEIGKPKALRAVAAACGANPIGVIIPCHRVVAKNGIGGYTGGLEKKKFLLALEKNPQ